MARELVFTESGEIYYDPGSGILSRGYPNFLLNPSGLWVPALADDDGNLLVAATVTVPPVEVSTASLTSVPSSASSVQVLPANSNRHGLIVYNDSNSICYLAFAASASAALFSEFLEPGSTYWMDPPVYTGVISAIWQSANGSLKVTEF